MSSCINVRPVLDEFKDQVLSDIELNQRIREIKVKKKEKSFMFDYLYGPNDSQETIFNEIAMPLLANFLDGGQTSSGKSYTMGLSSNMELSKEDKGLIPRIVEELFFAIGSYHEETHCKVSVTFVEIYQEQFRDLLCPETLPKRILLREKEESQSLVGAQEVMVYNESDINQLLELGTRNRSIGDTLMNQQSSRSHAIFTINLEKTISMRGNIAATITKKSKFQLVDLAGSERLDKTGAEGLRLKESVKINTGLLVLGKVISILGDSNPDKDHVPYRDSKLTSPLAKDLTESLSTLMYADRAKNIKNNPVMHIAHNEEQIEILEQIEGFIENLKSKGKYTEEMAAFKTPQWIQYLVDELESSHSHNFEMKSKIETSDRENQLLSASLSFFKTVFKKQLTFLINFIEGNGFTPQEVAELETTVKSDSVTILKSWVDE
ncbi:Kinesin-like protein kif27 [Boothiomyces sp. JEL0866]|nr:Kinesin-like protein kif27 [Boothiomyces sp. JEL0866]